ncbi:hypothetical protein [Pontiella sulfatireligans]|uniref:Uncharacterized protein n=1 Tax=Pontiella sulfatireligans TaxID=2750658 RepID=A0A6C2UM20_9BACT|nr:hypothetical protein [Pontiella sulfatireligans]VGO20477.1 hypothetical protein SCARR_02540 [Pontiella sulfatireligans]
MKKMRQLAIFAFAVGMTLAMSAQASTIVQWGESGGDSNIVSETQLIEVSGGVKTTFTAGRDSTANPVDPGYYTNVTAGTRSAVFNLSGDQRWGNRSIKTDTSGANIEVGQNKEKREAMIVWEDFLTTDDQLTTLAIEVAKSSAASNGVFRFLIQKGSGLWYASEETDLTTSYSAGTATNAADLTWYEYTPFSSAAVTIAGTASTIDMTDITSVGYYFYVDGDGNTSWKGAKIRYFKAEAIPGPIPTDKTIVQWGEAGGDTTIVAASTNFQNNVTTYTANQVKSPPQGDSYYSNNVERTAVFNHASSSTGNQKAVVEDGGGDFIGSGKNADTYRAMVVWEDLLGSESKLATLATESKVSAVAPTGTVYASGDFYWIIEKNTGQWYASDATEISAQDGFKSIVVEDASALTWNEFTPMVSGTATVGAPVTIEMTDVTSVGYYISMTNQPIWNISDGVTNGTKYANINTQTRYFKATAEPGPVSVQLIQWGASGGETDIVTSSMNLLGTAGTEAAPYYTTFNEGITNSPLGAAYYPSNTDRSPLFNYACGAAYGGASVSDGGTGADCIAFGKNQANYQQMVVWNDFLIEGASLNTLGVEIRGQNAAVTNEVRFLVQKGDLSWYASDAFSYGNSYTPIVENVADLTWYEFTPLSGGSATVTNEASIGFDATTNIVAVGYYSDQNNTNGAYQASNTRMFSATGLVAVEPPPAGYDGWAIEKGLTPGVNDGKTQDADFDGLNNYGEYVFGGLPLDDTNIGTQPNFIASGGKYVFSLIGDNTVVAYVVSTPDLVFPSWTTNGIESVSKTDGVLSAYTNDVGTAASELFLKLLVD